MSVWKGLRTALLLTILASALAAPVAAEDLGSVESACAQYEPDSAPWAECIAEATRERMRNPEIPGGTTDCSELPPATEERTICEQTQASLKEANERLDRATEILGSSDGDGKGSGGTDALVFVVLALGGLVAALLLLLWARSYRERLR